MGGESKAESSGEDEINGCGGHFGNEDGLDSISHKTKDGFEINKATIEKAGYNENKYFVWRQSDAIIYQGWLANARKRYSEICSVAHARWENNKEADNRIDENVRLSWIEFWKTSKFQEKSVIQKANRRSGVDGHPSTHTSGSASHRTVAARLKIKLKRDPTIGELFKEVHTRRVKKKKNPTYEIDEDGENDEDDEEIIWIDKKSQQTYELFEKLREQQLKCGQPVDEKALFLQATGGFDKKKEYTE